MTAASLFEPSVSVVIPTHNRRNQVAEAVASALAQTMSPREVLVIDDCSTDDTIDHLRSTFGTDTRVRVISQPVNAGACVARNAGIAAANGDWIAFLDSDDLWEPGKLKAQMNALSEASGYVASFCGMTAYRNGAALHDLVPPEPFDVSKLFVFNSLGSTSAAIVRADVLRAIGGFDPGMPSCQDWDLYLRVASTGPVSIVARSLVLYNEGDHARISNSQGKVRAGHLAMFARIQQLISDPATRLSVKDAHAFKLAILDMKSNDRLTTRLRIGARTVVRHPRRSLALLATKCVRQFNWARAA